MGAEDIKGTHESSNTNAVNVDGNSSVDIDETKDGSQKFCDEAIFEMDDLEQKGDEKKRSHAMTVDVDNDPIAQPPVQSGELVELSVSQVTAIDQREEQDNGEMDGGEGSGCKPECTPKESSVRVIYTSLPSRSKQKLEELLHKWSEWHAKNCASVEDPVDPLESGEETYFPAMHVGSDKSSTVSFSIDVHVRKRQRTSPLSTSNECSTLYDRGYAVGLASNEGVTEERAVDLREAPRCFNCGSYNHSLNECSKPRNNNAVNSARKQYLNKKNQNCGPRVPTRYYQESPRGKFDGLKPGELSAETRKLLGIGELDPPPWLNRMRELGYPPGYLQEEDPPSGISIFGDEDPDNATVKNDLPSDAQKSQRKMTVEFPGINAPVPENADPWLWTEPPLRFAPPPPNFPWDPSDNNRPNHSRESARPNYHPQPHYRHQYHHHHHHPHHHHPPPPPPPESPPPLPPPPPESPNYGRASNPGMPLLHFNYGSF